MGLSHLKPQVAKVETPGGVITVRGLNFIDIVSIVRAHQGVLNGLFSSIAVAQNGALSLDDTSGLIAALFEAAPEAAGMIIATGCDEPNIELALALPFPVQIEALEKIAALTFATEGGAKKVLETVLRVANGTTAALKSLRT